MRAKVKIHGTKTLKQIRKDYAKFGTKKAIEALFTDALKSLFKKKENKII